MPRAWCRGLEAAASEMVLQAGAALADGSVPETPWIRCGGVLRIDARASGEQLAIELAVLWDALEGQLVRIAFSDDEEREARGLLALQLAAALRGADAETREALFDLPIFDRSLRFGGVKLVTYPPNTAAAATRAA